MISEIMEIHFKIHTRNFEEVKIRFDFRMALILVFAYMRYCLYEVVLPFANRSTFDQTSCAAGRFDILIAIFLYTKTRIYRARNFII